MKEIHYRCKFRDLNDCRRGCRERTPSGSGRIGSRALGDERWMCHQPERAEWPEQIVCDGSIIQKVTIEDLPPQS
jgi:hypothetical protein